MAVVKDIYQAIDRWAPFNTQMDFDNSGFLVGRGERLINRILVALDITEPVIEEAKKRITAAFLYKSLCDINAALRKDKSFYHKETIRLGLEMAKLQQQIYSKE